MSLWIKICANTSLADARLAAEAGADAVGFVFAPSPRRVTAAQVAAIVPGLPDVETIGVFVDSPLDEIVGTVATCGLSGVQLYSAVEAGTPRELRRHFGPSLRILRVVPFAAGATELAATLASDPDVDAILVDSFTPAAAGGTGLTFDWKDARESLFASAPLRGRRLIVAGGLRPGNVAEAITTLRPWGIDVASGVEAVPGRKDPEKVRAFILNARAVLEQEQRA